MGVAWTTLEYKVDRIEAREIAIKEIDIHCYPKTDGKLLKNNLSHIKEQLESIKSLIQKVHPPSQ